jgi:multiple sugar transport system substrate-binding protein
MSVVLVISGCSRAKPGTGDSDQKAPFLFSRKPASDIIFLSTQLNPVEEAAKMRSSILKDFPGKVDFRPNDNSYIYGQVDVLLHDAPASSILIGAVHSDLVKLWEGGKLKPLENVLDGLEGRKFPESILKLSSFDGKYASYVPWMQASYIMVAHRKALAWLPEGADVENLTYAQFLEWGRRIFEKTGKRGLGFPAGSKGLMHRFFQGYLYPSFTGRTLLGFRSPDAEKMWSYFRQLWEYVNPASVSYSTMADPLLAGDVLVAWDHTARLMKAFAQKPDDFVAFRAPAGPKGRGFMPVVSGLAVPSGSSSTDDQSMLIDYLTQPEIQLRTLEETGFFPVLESLGESRLPPHLEMMKNAVAQQASGEASIPVLMPLRLGNRSEDFNLIYMLTFSRIVLEGKDIAQTLTWNAALLQQIVDEQNMAAWYPDTSEERPCNIE